MMFVFRMFMAIQIALYKLTNGRVGGNFGGADVLLLTSTGRKTGKIRTVPVMYVRSGENYAITASANGGPRHPGWYWNVTKGTQPVQIQVNDQVMNVTVEEAAADQRDQLYQRFIDMAGQFAGYEKKTTRKIPVLILTPKM